MKIMKDTVIEFLEQKKAATFDQVWKDLNSKLKSTWQNSYSTKEDELEKNKIGELYTMLTTNSDFIKDRDQKWSLTKFYTFDEAQKMKINVSELKDE